jgi:hypothetical protein
MSFLSAGELAQLRADALATLADDTCTILTPTTSANAIGERTITWGTAGTAVACRLRPSGRAPTGIPVGGQENTVAPWVVTLPHGTAVNPGDRLVIDSVTYEVLQTWDEETWKTASRVDVMRVE